MHGLKNTPKNTASAAGTRYIHFKQAAAVSLQYPLLKLTQNFLEFPKGNNQGDRDLVILVSAFLTIDQCRQSQDNFWRYD
jgi:hypothetical protein